MYMAMPSGNVVVPDKMHDGGAVVGGVEMMNYTQYQRQWVPDEREGFIRWIRCEFAAANAIIDSLCHHLKAIGEPGEYDGVIGNVQQRRANWHHILHMQQYYSVSEVVHSLQQVAWRRQQQRHHHNHRYSDPVKVQGKRFGGGSRQGHHRGVDYYSQEANAGSERGEKVSEKRDEEDVGSEIAKDDDKGMVHVEGKNGAGMSAKHQLDCSSNSFGNSQTNISATSEYQAEVVDNKLTSDSKGSCDVPLENGSPASQFVREKHIISNSVKTFVGTEILDGKSVNSVDGMKLYEELLDDFEVAKLVSMVNDMRTAGRKGQFQAGQTFIVSKRPMRGHGREMIQLGVPLADAPPEDEITVGTSKDRRIEPIPDFMHNVIERLMALEVITVKPDSCIIDVYNEGDHSQPHMWSYWFGRPVCVLFLTECDMTFGKVITVDQPGDYKGSIKLSFTPGWTKGASIGWHSDDNRPYLKQRDFAAVCYLNSYEVDFGGGLFHFQHGKLTDIVPMAGDVLIYTADSRNIHSVDEITYGERLTLTLWFTRDGAHDEDAKLISFLSGRLLHGLEMKYDAFLPSLASNNMYWFPPDEASNYQSGFDLCCARIYILGFDLYCSPNKSCYLTDSCESFQELLSEPLQLVRGEELFNKKFANILHALQVVQFYSWKQAELQTSEFNVKADNVIPVSVPQRERIKDLKLLFVKDYQSAETILNYNGCTDSKQSFDWTNFSTSVIAWEAYTSKLYQELLMSFPDWKTHQSIFPVTLKEP